MTDNELINIFPLRYLDATAEKNIGDIEDGGFALIRGTAVSDVKVSYIRRSLNIARVNIITGGRAAVAVWFNRPYVNGKVTGGAEYLFFGRVKINKNGSREIANPIFEETGRLKNLPGIIPVYGGNKDIPAAQLKSRIRAALKRAKPQSLLPQDAAAKYGLMPLDGAYLALHCPPDFETLALARRTVSLESLSAKVAMYSLIGSGNRKQRERRYNCDNEKLSAFIKALPYELTDSQKTAVKDIVGDLTGAFVMNRLLQGDVGSGKTAVAFCSAYFAAASGCQAAFMAPTEVLAKQHYRNAVPLFDNFGIRVALVTGSMNKAQKDLARFNIKHGNADIVIGTHALFSEDIEFRCLGLVITDEQHRFGVGQRKRLESKADAPDTLVMSATPIPRTLSLIMYGELNVSSLKEKPHGVGAVQTALVGSAKERDMYGFIAEQIEAGASAYFICARVEEDEGDDAGGDPDGPGGSGLVNVKSLCGRLKKTVLGKYGIGLLHGKMTEAEKARSMARFYEGKDKVLVSTTVIEVGIDVKTASVIVIYNAERFGLSQLHQLRGRVGRAGQKSWCFLLSDTENAETAERLNMLKSTQDGFALSEYDFEKRGAGDYFGERQHGGSGLPVTYEAVTAAKELAEELLKDSVARAALQRLLDESADLDELTRITMN